VIIKRLVVLSCVYGVALNVSAAGCVDYPYMSGDISAEETPAGIKILATGGATVDIDDIDEVQDALMEAEMEAKATISHFLNEEISSDKSIESAATKKITMVKGASGSTKDIMKEKVKTTLKKISNNSKSMLRGVVKLASCYEKGEKVLVSVGLKPETIAIAEKGTGSINSSMIRQPSLNNDHLRSENSSTSEEGQTTSNTGSTVKPPAGSYGMSKPDGFSKGLGRMSNF
jgi:hypothetical protein